MLKLAGSGLIILGASLCGFLKSSQLKKREEELGKIISALTFLEKEIVYEKRDIKSAMLSVGKIAGCELFCEVARGMEKGVTKAMEHAVDMCGDSLLGTDKIALLSLGESLGMSDTLSQVKSISYTKEQLLMLQKLAHTDYEKFGKMYKSLGLLSGLAIVILLI